MERSYRDRLKRPYGECLLVVKTWRDVWFLVSSGKRCRAGEVISTGDEYAKLKVNKLVFKQKVWLKLITSSGVMIKV